MSVVPEFDAISEEPAAQIGRLAEVVRSETADEPPWLIPQVLALGSITEVNGREKAGKGYFEAYLIGSLERGEATCFGLSERPKARTLIYTEEPVQSLKEKFDQFDINEAMVVYHWELAHLAWEDVVEWLVSNAVRLGASVIFIDNVSAAMQVEDEAGTELARRFRPLANKAKEHDLAILYDRHQRKTGGNVEDLARGSTGLAGAVDQIVAMQKTGKGRERKLTSWGRLMATNWEKQVELNEDHNSYDLLAGDYRQRILFERAEWTAKDYAEAANVSTDTARLYLQENPAVEWRARAGKNGADLYIVNKPPEID
jgi:hypothetical protein